MNGSKPSSLTSAPAGPAPKAAGPNPNPNPWPFSRLAARLGRFFGPLVELLKLPPPDTRQILQRIETMERDIVLPIRIAGIVILLQYFKPWIGQAISPLEVSIDATRYFVWAYAALGIGFAPILIWMRRLPPGVVERAVFAMSLVDAIFLGVLTLATGGYDSPLYWLFLGLIVRTAVSVPRATTQLLLNVTLSTCYVLAGVIDSLISTKLTDTELRVLGLYSVDNPAEPLLLRLLLLTVMTFGCYAVQVLLERQRQALEEAREFAVREVQLHAAGRLAAEFAHQIKNPLAIINTATFSLQRALKGRKETVEQLHMIQEEVERADRIITEVMGYAQLSEGHVERLDVLEELDAALARVFPPAARYPIVIHRDYGPTFPPLLMQRRHASETFVNVLQNAREALGESGGNVFVTARCLEDHSIEVAIRDDGPGIPPDKQGRVFEAYYTTKPKGTGLGLATVKHIVEVYGGSVRLESGLGKGACFVLLFPAKTLMNLAKTS
ncbi:MAG TPA: HAMP domain-containing sensor histidine kinase [Candidatus Acidoferrum sp.]|jgi:signal transduction histidine kinase|nr:HAMP domain-containing sensor histidine kinase [Candidatus Acidoferrum sp.]